MSAVSGRATHALAVTLAALFVASALPSAAAAGESWQADTEFVLVPQQIPGMDANAVTAFYRLRDPDGNQLGPVVEKPAGDPIERLEVPPVPGVYSL